MKKKFIVSLLASWIAFQALGQNLERHNWYFGNSSSGIRFNRSTGKAALVNNQAVPFGTGGSAVASDPSNANLMFYSDGQVVYDATHTQMLNGAGLSGNNAGNQPVAICPAPGQTNKYFLFTNNANFTTGGTISYSIIDMALFGNAVFPSPALGEVTATKNTPIPSLANRSEGMLIIPHSNNTDFWLITHQNGTQNYSATLINVAAFSGTFNTTVSSGIALPLTVASFSYHATLNKVAVAPQSANEDAIILNFDNTNGTFAFDRYIYNTGLPTATNQSIYDIEWSLSGQYLYLSRHGEAGINASLIQYDYVNSNTSTPLTILTPVLPAPVFRSYGLQMAPDSAIYHLYQAASGGPFLLGKISEPDSLASDVGYVTLPLGNSDFSGLQFPSFAPRSNVTLTVNFTSIGTCQNTPTSFFPIVSPAADSLNWNFDDGSTSNAWSPIHTYGMAQAFNVTLTAFYRGQSQQVTQPVNITAFPLQLQLVQDTTACRAEFPPPRGSSSPSQFTVTVKVTGGTPVSYTWSNGDVGPNLTPDSAGYYYVVVTDASGCSAYAGVNVKEYGLQDQRSNIWYFGNKAGIDFTPQPPVALNNSAMNAPEGCAIICDRNGKTILYTDGDNVYNKNDVLIDSGIGGETTASQSSIIVPVPGDETLYYIFTTQAINGTSLNEVRYSLFDLKQNSGLGAIVQKNILLFARSTERITANGSWVVIHEYGNSSFRAYPVTQQGIGDPVISDIGSDHSFQFQKNGEGYMKLGPRNNLAVALSTPGTSNLVELFHLNDTTGKINNYRKIDLKEPAGEVYGIEFSPGGNKLFATVKGTPSPSKLFEYFIDSIGQPYFKQQIQHPVEMGALQIGPDGLIYMAINGSNVLGTIIASDDTTQFSSLNISGFALAPGTVSNLGLPNFIQNVSNAVGGPGFDVTGLCLGFPTQFAGMATDAIDNFLWSFGDGGTDTQPAPVHTYAAAGTYTVSMHLTNRCGLDTLIVKQITIAPPPPPPTIPGATALCSAGSVVLDANATNIPGLTYLWSDGQTTKTITVSEQSFIGVINTDANGCFSTAQTIVADNRPQVDLGPDVSICEDNATPGLNALNPGANYQWQINGVNSGTAQAQAVDTTLPGVFIYQVTVTDPITTCNITDTKTYTIKVSPQLSLSGTNPTGCGLTNGTLALNLLATNPAGGPYSFFLTGPAGFNDLQIDQVPGIFNYINRGAGTYSGIVTDQISGCTMSTSFGLSDATFTANAASMAPNCDPVTLSVTSNAVALPLQYTITGGTTVVAGPTNSATASFTAAPPLPAGVYTIQLRDNLGCILTLNHTITPNPPVPVTLTPDMCSNPPTISASGATGYTWTGPGIVGGASASTVQINPGPGQFTYTLTATAAGQCPNTQSITVDVDNAANANFTQSDACQTTVLLDASPAGTYTYRWFKAGVFQPALLGQTISLGQSENGASYNVALVNTLNGCVYSSPAKVVNVVGPVTAALTSTPPCQDGNPFTLTAVTAATGVTYGWSLNGTTIAGVTTPSTAQTQDGAYKVDITKSVCSASATIQIVKAPVPSGALPNRVIICADPDNQDITTSQVDLDPGAFNAYNWFKNELTLSYTSRVLTADTKGMYKVELTNSFGCRAFDETEVLDQCIPKIEAPTAFRPTSAQPPNREFYVYTYFITDDFEVFIFNRWGELVFESKDRNFKWNGGYKNNPGQPLPGGAYAYVIKYKSSFRPDLGIQEKHGGVALIR